MRKKMFFIGLAVFLHIPLFAQTYNETLTLTTYYPSPHGVYRTVRLYPVDQPPSGNERPGTLYFNGSEVFVYKGAPDNSWQPMGNAFWQKSGSNITNTNSGSVLINSTQGTIVLSNGTLLLPITGSAAASNGAIRFTGSGFEGYYNGKWNPLVGESSSPAPAAVNGTCAVNGGVATPVLGPMCASGTGSGFASGGSSGPWTWSCVGSNGGTSARCSAVLNSVTPYYTNCCPSCSYGGADNHAWCLQYGGRSVNNYCVQFSPYSGRPASAACDPYNFYVCECY